MPTGAKEKKGKEGWVTGLELGLTTTATGGVCSLVPYSAYWPTAR